MPANAASRALHLPEQMEKDHTVLFAVYTRLVASDIGELEAHLPEHLAFLKGLKEKGVVPMAGPFLTPEGKNSGNGFYVLQVDSLDEAKQIAAEDPMHQKGIRKPDVMPWAKDDK